MCKQKRVTSCSLEQKLSQDARSGCRNPQTQRKQVGHSCRVWVVSLDTLNESVTQWQTGSWKWHIQISKVSICCVTRPLYSRNKSTSRHLSKIDGAYIQTHPLSNPWSCHGWVLPFLPLNEGGQRRSKYVKVTSATEAWQLVGACSDAAVLSRSFASFFFLISWPVAFRTSESVWECQTVQMIQANQKQITNHKQQRAFSHGHSCRHQFPRHHWQSAICLQFRTQIPSNLSFSSVGRVSARSHLALSWRRHANKSEVAWVTSSVWGLLALLWILMPTHWQTFWLKLGRNGWGETQISCTFQMLKTIPRTTHTGHHVSPAQGPACYLLRTGRRLHILI